MKDLEAKKFAKVIICLAIGPIAFGMPEHYCRINLMLIYALNFCISFLAYPEDRSWLEGFDPLFGLTT